MSRDRSALESNHDNVPAKDSIGLLAGWGDFPVYVAETLRRQGYRVVGLGFHGHASRDLSRHCDVYREIGIAKLGGAIRFLKRHGVRRATMAGKIHKTVLFRRFLILRHLPDLKCLLTFYPHLIANTKDSKDDTLLNVVVDTYAQAGIEFAPATNFAPELLVKFGTLAGRRLTSGQQKDIQFGWQIAKELGRLDCGQTVAVKGQAVLALEAVEGTDQCIRRAGELCPAGGFTVVKVAKPQQDMRFDVPTIGLGTLEVLKQAGGKVLAIEADKTIVIQQDEVCDYAARNGLTVVALRDGAERIQGDAAA
ncbi:MAG: UDP-2,3-diacylglucosamine diphosphatase LpxI [Pirellulaceae bacterium]